MFRFYPLRFEFVAEEPLFFAPGKAANILRGALGLTFRRLACRPDCPSAKICPNRHSCSYARIFEPSANGETPSGLADWPRPFVFRARTIDGCAIAPGVLFSFDLHLFTLDPDMLALLVRTFGVLAGEGLGPGRGKSSLRSVTSGTQTVYKQSVGTISREVSPVSLSLSAAPEAPRRILVEFLTPMELKCAGRVVETPEFPILFARIRDRIATLHGFYGEGSLDIDFTGTGERAAAIKMTRCDIRRQQTERRSTKTGQSHSIGGFTGIAEYEGDLAEFLPYLEVAQVTGAGRQCVWGKGEIRVTAI